WLGEREVYYWGDLDTHGFAMLDRLRVSFPATRSLLMNRATLLAHQPLWGTEEAQHIAALGRLTPDEAALYADLRYDRLGRSVRLEQERISFGWLHRAPEALGRLVRPDGGRRTATGNGSPHAAPAEVARRRRSRAAGMALAFLPRSARKSTRTTQLSGSP